MAKAQRSMQVSYPVAMTKKVTLFHHLTQIHFQRFFQQASTRMASIQGLQVNQETEQEIEHLENVFNEILLKSQESLATQQQSWTSRLEANGVDPGLDGVHGGETFDAPITTPWSMKLLKIYQACDRVLLMVEMTWIAEEFSVLEKREASNNARAPLVECARQIQRAVTQAFQEAKRKQQYVAVPPAYGDAGKLLYRQEPEALEAIKTANARDTDAFNATVEDLKAKTTDPDISHALEEVRVIRLALVKREADKAGAESKARAIGAAGVDSADAEEEAAPKKTARKTRKASDDEDDSNQTAAAA